MLSLVLSSHYFSIPVWTLDLHTPSSLCSLTLYLLMSIFPLAASAPRRPLSWHKKREWQQVCLWFPVEWWRLTENTLLHSSASFPMDMQRTQCSALYGVKSAEGSWAVEEDEGLGLSWGTEFFLKKKKKIWGILVPFMFKKKKERKVLLSLVETTFNGWASMKCNSWLSSWEESRSW